MRSSVSASSGPLSSLIRAIRGNRSAYVIVHRENLTKQQINLVQALFEKASKGAPVVYEDGSMIVYTLNK
jgi:hypothetical protein